MAQGQRVGGLTFVTGDMSKGWADAERFAGPGGHVATLPDVIDARLAVEPDVQRRRTAWDSYITTTSAEYAGLSKGGTAILIVAHGVGPLATREGAMAAYERCKPRGDHVDGGVRIPRAEFLKLEAGAYGPVSIVPLDEVRSRYAYPFMTPLSLDDARDEPLVAARLGPHWEQYLAKHDAFVRGAWGASRSIRFNDNYAGILLDLDQPSDCWYALGAVGRMADPHFKSKGLETYPAIGGSDPSEAFAHLLVAGQLTNTNYAEHRQTMLVTEIGIHGATDHCRFLGLRKDADLASIAADVSARDLLRKHWRDLLVPLRDRRVPPHAAPIRCIRSLSPKGDRDFFTITVKEGHEMDSGVAEHPCRSAKKLCGGEFVTKIAGYYGFLRYSLQEVAAIAPPEANAYVLGDSGFTDGDRTHHRVEVEFYQADIDFDRRLMTAEELEDDFNLFTRLGAAHSDA